MREEVSAQPDAEGLSSVLHRNIEALRERRVREERSATVEEKIAAAITRFSGSMAFVYIHLAAVLLWISWNVGLIPGVKAFDPSFVILATAASVEAIFLSTFVLISQNRMAAAADKRADLDLQISLLAEHELTRIARLLAEIAKQMDIPAAKEAELEEVKRDIAPDPVLDRIEMRGP